MWQTFWMEPTNQCRLALRRYSRSETAISCKSGGGYHNAKVWLPDVVDAERDEGGHRSLDNLEAKYKPAEDDPRWPTQCADCDYQFTDKDRYQLWSSDLWRRTDNGELRVMHHEPPEDVPTAEIGATWDSYWLHGTNIDRYPDGIVFTVRCPPLGAWNDWIVDHEASSGGFWTRTGDPRECNVTASPSIAIGMPGTNGYYHGFLQNGKLTDPLPA